MSRKTRPIEITPEVEATLDKWTAVNPESGCWEWTGHVSTSGYGARSFGSNEQFLVHRVSYTRHNGPIPAGLVLDHLCRNTRCLNPEHLEAVTDQENVRRGMSPGAKALRREECLRGHLYSDYGRIIQGRRACAACASIRLKAHRARNALAKRSAA